MKIRFPSSHRTNCFPFNSIGESGKNRENTGICNDDSRFPHMGHKHFNNFDNGTSYYNESKYAYWKLIIFNNHIQFSQIMEDFGNYQELIT